MPKQKGDGVTVVLDPLTRSRLQRQAQRRFGTLQGSLQNYLREAAMRQLQEDEQKEAKMIKVADMEAS